LELSFDFDFLWLTGGDFTGAGACDVELEARRDEDEGLVGSFSGVGGRTG
jgi:hypothetical protein